MPRRAPPKHRRVFEVLQGEIAGGRFADGRLPGEVALAARFAVSRPTVARALDALRRQGVVERRPGLGTRVRPAAGSGRLLGLIGAGLGHTEILGELAEAIAAAAEAAGHRLIRGDAGQDERSAAALRREFLQRGVAGVLLAPLERSAQRERLNRRLVEPLAEAGVATVLLDRDLLDFPGRSALDLVAVDDVRAGYRLAAHLLRGGWPRLALVARPAYPSTTDLRFAGCRQAAAALGCAAVGLHVGDPGDPAWVRGWLGEGRLALAAANDATALALLASLRRLGVAVPRRARLGGFDDAGQAASSPVPLTTMRLPCRDLGRLAVATLLQRLGDPGRPPHQALLDARLIVRASG